MSIASPQTAAKPAERMNAREAMESLNAEAGKFNIWLRTQANAPAQRPWFRDTGIEASGTLAASADDERIGVERIHHFVEEETQGMSLHAENLLAQRIALLRQTAHTFGRWVDIVLMQRGLGPGKTSAPAEISSINGEKGHERRVS